MAPHFCEPQIPEFNPWNMHGGRWELTVTYTNVPWHVLVFARM